MCKHLSNFVEDLLPKNLFGTGNDPQKELETLIKLFRGRGKLGTALSLSKLKLMGSGNRNEWNHNLALLDALCVELKG